MEGSMQGGNSALQISDSSDTTWSDFPTKYRRNGLSRSCHCGEKSSRSKESKRTKLVKTVTANGRSKHSIQAASPVLRSSNNKGSPHQVSEGKTRLSRALSASSMPGPKCTNNNHHKTLSTGTASSGFEPHRNGKWPSCHLRSQQQQTPDGSMCQSNAKHCQQQQHLAPQPNPGLVEGTVKSTTSASGSQRRKYNQRDQTTSIAVSGQGEPHAKLLIIEDQHSNGLPVKNSTNHQCDLGIHKTLQGGNNTKTFPVNGVRVVVGSKASLNGFDATFYKQIASLAYLGQNGCVPVAKDVVSDIPDTDNEQVSKPDLAVGSECESTGGSTRDCGACETDSASKYNSDKGSLQSSASPHLNGAVVDNHWDSHNEPFTLAGISTKQAASQSRTSRQHQHGSQTTAAAAAACAASLSVPSSHSSLTTSVTSSSSTSSLQSLSLSSSSQARDSCKRTLPHSKSSPCISSSSSAPHSQTKAAIAPENKTVKCLWKKCSATPNAPDLMDHIQREHVNTQSGESFVCLWDGCRVYNKKSCSRQWLERHCVNNHSGNKPFFCIFDGCGQRFLSHRGLERHVNSHFNACQTAQNKLVKSKEDTPSKSQKRKNKTRKKTPWKVKKTDFIDGRTMDAIQRSLFSSQGPLSVQSTYASSSSSSNWAAAASGSRVTFQSTVIARRQQKSGANEVLLHWTPTNMIPDEWITESQAILPQQQIRTIPISMLPRDVLDQLDPGTVSPQHRRRKHPRK